MRFILGSKQFELPGWDRMLSIHYKLQCRRNTVLVIISSNNILKWSQILNFLPNMILTVNCLNNRSLQEPAKKNWQWAPQLPVSGPSNYKLSSLSFTDQSYRFWLKFDKIGLQMFLFSFFLQPVNQQNRLAIDFLDDKCLVYYLEAVQCKPMVIYWTTCQQTAPTSWSIKTLLCI